MTVNDQDAAIGALVRKYQETTKTIASLRVKLDSIGDYFKAIGDQLRSCPEGVPESEIVAEPIRRLIGQLKTCVEEQRRMEDYLRQAGMENLITIRRSRTA